MERVRVPLLALTQMNAEIDVRQVLPSIRVPTLVIHRSGDLCLKVEEGRYVRTGFPVRAMSNCRARIIYRLSVIKKRSSTKWKIF